MTFLGNGPNNLADYSNVNGPLNLKLAVLNTDKNVDQLIDTNSGAADTFMHVQKFKLSKQQDTLTIDPNAMPALNYIQEIDAGQNTGESDKLDLSQLPNSVKFVNDHIDGTKTKFDYFTTLNAGWGNDTVTFNGAGDESWEEVDLGNGNDTITSDVPGLTVNLGNGNDTIGPMGPGSVINAGQGKDIFTVSDDILINGTGGNPNDEIVADGQVIHGFVGPINSDSPWITSIYNGISYGINNLGQLAIKDTSGDITYVAGYSGGPSVPLSQQTDGIFVGRGSFKSSRLADLKRSSIEEDRTVFKFGNEIAFIRLGHPFFANNDDPLALDLTGNGVNLTGESSAAPMFDMNGTGFAVHTGWVQPGTGLLVLPDANGNVVNINQLIGGENNSGSESSPPFTGGGNNSGFAALAQFDTNHDGVIDANDPIFTWRKVSNYREGGKGHNYRDDLRALSLNLNFDPIERAFKIDIGS